MNCSLPPFVWALTLDIWEVIDLIGSILYVSVLPQFVCHFSDIQINVFILRFPYYVVHLTDPVEYLLLP